MNTRWCQVDTELSKMRKNRFFLLEPICVKFIIARLNFTPNYGIILKCLVDLYVQDKGVKFTTIIFNRAYICNKLYIIY